MYMGRILGVNGVFFAQIYRNLNGTWTRLSSVRVAGGTATLRFEAIGSSLKLFVDGTLRTSAFDTKLTTGTVGLRSSAGQVIDDFDAMLL
jgi:hypothetical protein